MPRIIFTDEEISVEKATSKMDFRKPSFKLEERIMAYTGSRRLAGEGAVVYGSLAECFGLHLASRKKFISLLGSGSQAREAALLSTLYSLHIGARNGRHILGNGSDDRKDLRLGTFGDGKSNAFIDNFEIDPNGSYPRQYNNLLMAYADTLDSGGDDKNITELTKDFYDFIIHATSGLARRISFNGLMDVISRNPVNYRILVFNGFSEGMEVKAKRTEKLEWGLFKGYDDYKRVLQSYEKRVQNLDALRERYQKRMDKLLPNLLIVGPTGCGKTYGVEILASRLADHNVPFYCINIADVLDTYKDGAAKKMSNIFRDAALPLKKGLCSVSILYIDEGDSLVKRRYSAKASDEDTKVTEIFLTNTGKRVQQPGLVVMASSNIGGAISPAALRRFGKVVRLPYPDAETQKELFMHFADGWQKEKEGVFGELDYSLIVAKAYNPLVGIQRRYCAGDIENIVDNVANDAVDNSPAVFGGRFSPAKTADFLREIKKYSESRRFENEHLDA